MKVGDPGVYCNSKNLAWSDEIMNRKRQQNLMADFDLGGGEEPVIEILSNKSGQMLVAVEDRREMC